ncbi:MAG: hypothetical protein HN454_05815, partial [Gammaproteobacteria bacterium]|nr:hypothetical protein [Gammaproteobacteria bacterium]
KPQKQAVPKSVAVKKAEAVQPKAAIKTSTKSATKTTPKRSSKRRKHIQMATFTSKKRAHKVVKDLRDAKFKAEVTAVTSRGKRYYLVRDYSPKNRKQALELKKIYDEWLSVESLVRY